MDNYFWRFLACVAIVAISLIVYFFVWLFSSISFWWVLVIIPIDTFIIGGMITDWKKEDAEAERKEMAFWDSI